MAINAVEIPANLVKTGDVVFHDGRGYPIVHINRLSDVVQLQHAGGFFNFELGRIVRVLEKRPTTESFIKPTTTRAVLAHEVRPGNILSYGIRFFEIKEVKDLGEIPENVVRLTHVTGYFDFSPNRIVHIVNTPPAQETPTIEFSNQITPIANPVFLPVENNMETLNIQNAIEAQRILLQKLEQMLDLQQLAPTEDGKIAIGNCNIRVDKASIVKAARDEMKAAASKSAELIKKL